RLKLRERSLAKADSLIELSEGNGILDIRRTEVSVSENLSLPVRFLECKRHGRSRDGDRELGRRSLPERFGHHITALAYAKESNAIRINVAAPRDRSKRFRCVGAEQPVAAVAPIAGGLPCPPLVVNEECEARSNE